MVECGVFYPLVDTGRQFFGRGWVLMEFRGGSVASLLSCEPCPYLEREGGRALDGALSWLDLAVSVKAIGAGWNSPGQTRSISGAREVAGIGARVL